MSIDPVWSRTRAAFDLHTAWLRPQASKAQPDTEESVPVSIAQEKEAKRAARPPLALATPAPAGLTQAQLQAALLKATSRYPVLRTSFSFAAAQDSRQKRLVASIAPELKAEDVNALVHVMVPDSVDISQIVAQQQASPFALEKGSLLLRAVLVTGDRPVLVLAADRLIADAHSLHIIARELLQVHTFPPFPPSEHARKNLL